jgi:hypothetical protein
MENATANAMTFVERFIWPPLLGASVPERYWSGEVIACCFDPLRFRIDAFSNASRMPTLAGAGSSQDQCFIHNVRYQRLAALGPYLMPWPAVA